MIAHQSRLIWGENRVSKNARAASCATLVFYLLLATAVAPNSANAIQNSQCATALQGGEISDEWVEQMIENRKQKSAQQRRIQAATRISGYPNVALNWDIIEAHDPGYTHELLVGKATNQASSGRCWIFAGLNVIRSHMMARQRASLDFELSQSYLHFFNMLEKSNFYFEEVIEKHNERGADNDPRKLRELVEPHAYIGDGGWWSYFQYLVKKYGLVPKSAMQESLASVQSGLLQEELTHHISSISSAMMEESHRLQQGGMKPDDPKLVEALRAIKERGMRGVWKILSTHLGDPPTEFDYRVTKEPAPMMSFEKPKDGKELTPEEIQEIGRAWIATPTQHLKFTPKDFLTFSEFVPEDYVTISANNLVPAGKVYVVENSSIAKTGPGEEPFHRKILNMDHEIMAQLTAASLTAGYGVWFAADMSKDVEHQLGIMHPELYEREGVYDFDQDEIPQPMSPGHAQYFGYRRPNHAMAIMGMDLTADGEIIKFKNENSWGKHVGNKGFYALYLAWFNENVFEVIVHRRFVPDEALEVYDNGPFETVPDEMYYYAPEQEASSP